VMVSTKAKPRGRPVSRSSATRTLRSSMPSPVNASRSSCSVTAYERLPMKSRVPIRPSVFLLLGAVTGAVLPRRSRRAVVDPVLQLLACFEDGNAAGLDLNLGARLGVAALAGSGFTDGEGAESAQVDTLAFRETFRDGLD